jgi:putative flippase GtrA
MTLMQVWSSIVRFLNFRLSKTLVVGALASIADMSTLICLVQLFGIRPEIANIPSLMVGSTLQFLGNRQVVYHSNGVVKLQLLTFICGELVSLTLNGSGYYLMVTHTSIHYAVARPIVSAIIFTCFSYPLWRYIFSHSHFGNRVQ